jgi:hypothetical protein
VENYIKCNRHNVRRHRKNIDIGENNPQMALHKKITPDQIVSIADGLKTIGLVLIGIIQLFKKKKKTTEPTTLTQN